MNVIANTDNTRNPEIKHHENVAHPHTAAKRRGRPRGSKNKPKFAHDVSSAPREEGWEIVKKLGRPRSLATHRKWQRDFLLPQFVLTRKQAHELLVKHLRSKPGKDALDLVVNDGFIGISKLPDVKLGEFLVSTNLLSRYPHEIVIRGS